MKLALLLPGYIESPDYRHLIIIDNKLTSMGYTVVRVDPCALWETGDGQNYTTTRYINQVKDLVNSYLPQQPTEIILVGHSLGCLVALLVGHLFDEVTKIVCLSLPSSLNNSDHKWVDGFRISKKDLPDNPTELRTFTIPFSFAIDRNHYSIPISLKNNQKPLLIIMGDEDPSTPKIGEMIKGLSHSTFIKIPAMGHDFRQSEELCNKVVNEIRKFLEK